MSQDKSIRDFFKSQPTAKATVAGSTFKVPSLPATRSSNVPPSSPPAAPKPSCATNSPEQQSCTSNLSPPPRSNDVEWPTSQHLPRPSSWGKGLSERVIQNSDDEEDSDSSLEDLSTLLAARSSCGASRPRTSGDSAKIPRYHTRTKNLGKPARAASPKYKFDLKDLIAHKKNDEAAEASSKRFKAMQELEEDGDVMIDGEAGNPLWSDHSALLDAVVADREEGAASKVKRALRRTEATVSDPRWYFFDTEAGLAKPERKPFPVAAVPESWKSVLEEPRMREQAFLFGFAEDMVAMGQGLPDELYLWMLDEVPVESSDPLRTAYLNIFRQCREQTSRLITPLAIQKIFRSLGGTVKGTILTERVRTVQRLTDPYPNRDWTKLHSIIKWFRHIAKILDSGSRTYIINLLLRMSVDKVVSSNGDIHDSVQQAISLLCLHIPDEDWDSFVCSLSPPTYHQLTGQCFKTCQTLSESTHEPTLRLQAIESISSTTPRSHDLRRRLATVFFLDDLSYSESHSHTTFSIGSVLDRLMDPLFDTTPTTNYRDLTSLIYLFDITVDDGQNVSLDLAHEETAERHDENVDELIDTLAAIESGIVATGGIFVSRLDARMALLMVQKRLAMLRTKPKPKHHWFDGSEKRKAQKEEEKRRNDLSRQKDSMARFLKKKSKSERDGVDRSAGSETDGEGTAGS
ncbi:hypothetical protein QTJ16_003835 [Diplocarpon rosae]|uniref:Uncharacterized protein n=1 Tax=Diplocarpon rosae TaxID=946125 RepID=A0AAD9T1P2_9HELO|nr:hypothetical protein QTJ16_003835 [Diplocarpon rosae]